MRSRVGDTAASAEHRLGDRPESSIRTEPIVFGDDPPLLGVLTTPEDRASDGRGVVLCAPLFHQNICSYRPLRNLGVRLAEQGWPVLRFDWPGCGDSGDVVFTSISTWTTSVHDALAAIRESTGVSELVLVGLRFGATLAYLAALTEPSVSAIAMLAPHAKGRAYLRELRSFEAMVQHVFSEPEVAPPPLPAGAMEAGGFLISSAEVREIESMDLITAASASSPPKRALIAVAQPDRGATALVDSLAACGTEVDYTVIGELARAWDGTLASYMPGTCSDLVCRWLGASVGTSVVSGG